MTELQLKELHNANLRKLVDTPQGLFVVSQVTKSLRAIEALVESLPSPQDRNVIMDQITNVWADKVRMNNLISEITRE